LIKGIHRFSDTVNGLKGPLIMGEKGNEIETPFMKKNGVFFD
jgi:hypothetical protein